MVSLFLSLRMFDLPLKHYNFERKALYNFVHKNRGFRKFQKLGMFEIKNYMKTENSCNWKTCY